jgi:hypothetical protein
MIRTRAKRFSGKIVLNQNEKAGRHFDGDPSRCRTCFVSGQPESLADGKALSPGKVASSM